MARFIPVWQLKNLFAVDQVPKPVWLSPHDVRDFIHTAESTALLGANADRAHFSVGLPSQQDSPPQGNALSLVAALAISKLFDARFYGASHEWGDSS